MQSELIRPNNSRPFARGMSLKLQRALETWINGGFREPPSMYWRQPPQSALIGAGNIIELPNLSQKIEVVRAPMKWANWISEKHHYLGRPIPPRARPLGYAIVFDGDCVGMLTVATPNFVRMRYPITHEKACQPLFGFDNSLSHWQVLVLSRLWLHPVIQHMKVRDSGGRSHTFPLASASISKLLRRVQFDWLEAHPPIHQDDPYHIRLILSYSDQGQGHTGGVYKAAGFEHLGVSRGRRRQPGPRGAGVPTDKDIWAYVLPEPAWSYGQISLDLTQ